MRNRFVPTRRQGVTQYYYINAYCNDIAVRVSADRHRPRQVVTYIPTLYNYIRLSAVIFN